MVTLRLFKIIFGCAFALALCQGSIAAELTWTGGPITVGAGDQLEITDDMISTPGDNIATDVTVANGGTLIISADTFTISDSLDNSGKLIVTGHTTLSSGIGNVANTGTIIVTNKTESPRDGNLRIPGDKLEELIKNGKLIIGYQDMDSVTAENWDPQKVSTAGLEYASTPHDFRATQFVTEFKGQVNNEILMGAYGFLRLGYAPVNITGDELTLGKIRFADVYNMYKGFDKTVHEVTQTGMSRVRSRHLTLKPDTENGWVTLKSGIVQIGGGRGSADSPTDLDGSLTLEGRGLKIDGGVLLLGAAGNMEGEDLNVRGDITIGTDSETIDSALITKAGEWLLTGNLILNKSGYLEVGQTYISGLGEEMTSTLTIDGDFNILGKYTVDQNNLEVLKNTIGNPDTEIQVLENSKLKLTNAKMEGGQINLAQSADQEAGTIARIFREAASIVNAPQGALSFDSNTIDARINAGQNSLLTLGSADPRWLADKMEDYQGKSGKIWGQDMTAAVAIRAPQTLSPEGGLNVDGSWKAGGDAAKANTARFADKSLLVIDGAALKGKTALDGNGTAALVVEQGAGLLITDAAVGDTFTVTDNFASSRISEEGWAKNSATSTDLQFVEASFNPATGEYTARITNGAPVQTAFPGLAPELAAVVETASMKGLDTNAPRKGLRFISRAVDNRYIGSNDAALAARTIESAARMAVVGAAPQMTLAANNAAAAAITQRTGLAQPNGIIMAIDESGNYIAESQNRFARNFGLWIMPLYQSTNGFGMEAGNFEYDFSGALGGVALGADYTIENTFRIGAAFNIGGGYAAGTGDLNKTTNNMNFWGIGAYAGWAQNNFGLTADVNYTSTYNKIRQDVPAAMAMGNLKADIRGNAISAGLRAEFKAQTDYLDITPHAGFRYINLFTNPYNVKSGGKILHGRKSVQNIWTFPIGVSFTKEYPLENNWHFKPLLDVNVTPVAGNVKAKSKIIFNGINQQAELNTKIMDYITYGGTAGIEFGNDTISFGVNYNGQFGAESSAHSVFGTLRVEF